MNVDDVVAAKVAAARARITANKTRRATLQQARDAGLVARHAAKIARLDQKGGANQLGARVPGEVGPFGPYGAEDDLEDDLDDDDQHDQAEQ